MKQQKDDKTPPEKRQWFFRDVSLTYLPRIDAVHVTCQNFFLKLVVKRLHSVGFGSRPFGTGKSGFCTIRFTDENNTKFLIS